MVQRERNDRDRRENEGENGVNSLLLPAGRKSKRIATSETAGRLKKDFRRRGLGCGGKSNNAAGL